MSAENASPLAALKAPWWIWKRCIFGGMLAGGCVLMTGSALSAGLLSAAGSALLFLVMREANPLFWQDIFCIFDDDDEDDDGEEKGHGV